MRTEPKRSWWLRWVALRLGYTITHDQWYNTEWFNLRQPEARSYLSLYDFGNGFNCYLVSCDPGFKEKRVHLRVIQSTFLLLLTTFVYRWNQ